MTVSLFRCIEPACGLVYAGRDSTYPGVCVICGGRLRELVHKTHAYEYSEAGGECTGIEVTVDLKDSSE